MMYNFTKEELELIHAYMFGGSYNVSTEELYLLECKIQSMIDGYCEHLNSFEERISGLEQWAINHDVEGMAYGKEFEERDEQLIERIERIERFLNSMGDE